MNIRNNFDVQIGYSYACGHHSSLVKQDVYKNIFALNENDRIANAPLAKLVDKHKYFLYGYNLYFTESFENIFEKRTLNLNNLSHDMRRMIKKGDYLKMTISQLVNLLKSLTENTTYSTYGPLIITLSKNNSNLYFSYDTCNSLISTSHNVTAEHCTTSFKILKNKYLKLNTYQTLLKMFSDMNKSASDITPQDMSEVSRLVSNLITKKPKILEVIPREVIDYLFELLSNQISHDCFAYPVVKQDCNIKVHDSRI